MADSRLLLTRDKVAARCTTALDLVEAVCEGHWDGALSQDLLRELNDAATAVLKRAEAAQMRLNVTSLRARIQRETVELEKLTRKLADMEAPHA
jgi:hypothetical protein